MADGMFLRLPIGSAGLAPTVFLEGVPGGRPVEAALIVAQLAGMVPPSPLRAPEFLPILLDAGARLTAIARGTGGDAQVILSRQADGSLRHSVSAGAGRFDNRTPGWSTPRPGDRDYLWVDRACSVLDDLAAAGWLDALAGSPPEAALVARATGVYLFASPGTGAPPLAHVLAPAGNLRLAGFQPCTESRSLVERFEAYAPLEYLSVEGFAAGIVADIARFIVPLEELDADQQEEPVFAASLAGALARVGEGDAAAARSLLVHGIGLFEDEADAWLSAQGIDPPVSPASEAETPKDVRQWFYRLPAIRLRRPAAQAA